MSRRAEFIILDLATMTIEVEDKFNDFDFELFATDDGQKLVPVWFENEDPPLVHVEYSENGWYMFFAMPAFARYRDFFGELDRIGQCSRWKTKYWYEAQDAVPGFYISALVYNVKCARALSTIETLLLADLSRELILHVRSFLWW